MQVALACLYRRFDVSYRSTLNFLRYVSACLHSVSKNTSCPTSRYGYPDLPTALTVAPLQSSTAFIRRLLRFRPRLNALLTLKHHHTTHSKPGLGAKELAASESNLDAEASRTRSPTLPVAERGARVERGAQGAGEERERVATACLFEVEVEVDPGLALRRACLGHYVEEGLGGEDEVHVGGEVEVGGYHGD